MKAIRSHVLIPLTLVLALLLVGSSGLAQAQDPTPPIAEPQSTQAALGTAFTYQGRLNDGANPANGAYDLQFKLFDAASVGTQIGATASKNDLPVSGGLFTTDLDFGASAFDGQARWLEVAVRPGASTGVYTTLAPRRALLASPYATYSSNTRGLNVSPAGNRLTMTSSDPGYTDILVGNTTSGLAGIVFDAVDGNFEGGDYAWINQRNNLDLAIGNHGDAARIIVKPNGYIGIGTTDPSGLLTVADSGPQTDIRVSNSGGGTAYIGMDARDGDFTGNDYAWIAQRHNGDLAIGNSGDGDRITVKPDGKVGIGTSDPAAKLEVIGDIDIGFAKVVGGSPTTQRFSYDGKSMGHYSLGWFSDSWNPGSPTAWLSGFAGVKFFSGGAPRQVITADGRVGIGTTNPQAKLDVAGTTRTDVLQIDAGADLAERFEVSGDTTPEPGVVVIVDEEHPGQLIVSQHAYDTRVIGVISGAGGIQPGLTLHQEGLLDGNTQVAIAGRVYVKAEAMSGSIKPGDLLTTSAVPGHVMKASDHDRAFGAVVGKALTGLADGTGLVLVLVNLQ